MLVMLLGVVGVGWGREGSRYCRESQPPRGCASPMCKERGVLRLTEPRRADGAGTAVSGALMQARTPRVVCPRLLW